MSRSASILTADCIKEVAPLSEAETLFLEGADSGKQDPSDTPTIKRGAILEARIRRTVLEVNGKGAYVRSLS